MGDLRDGKEPVHVLGMSEVWETVCYTLLFDSHLIPFETFIIEHTYRMIYLM